MAETIVSPSVLAADFANLERDVKMLNESDAQYIHIDIMDGVFVPNISFGFPVTQAINKIAEKPLDFHLMIKDADPYLQSCIDSGAEIISVHYEACQHLHRTISEIKRLGAKAGVVLNPHTNIDLLDSILEEIDLVLLMSVNPGFGGQKFISNTVNKVQKLRGMANEKKPELIIEVDGGVNLETGKLLVDAGANMLVAGSFIFKSNNPKETINKLRNL